MQRRRGVGDSANSLSNRSALSVRFWLRPTPPLRRCYVLIVVRAIVELVCRVGTNRRRLRLEHLSDLFKRLATIESPGLEFHRNGAILLWSTPRPRHANIRPPGCDNFALDLDVAESRSCFSAQHVVYIGLLGSPIWSFGELMVSNFVRKRTCDSGALPDRVLVNNDLHTGNKVGALTGWPPLDNYTVASRLRETRLKCWGFRQKWRQRGINQWRSRTTCASRATILLLLRQSDVFSALHAAVPTMTEGQRWLIDT